MDPNANNPQNPMPAGDTGMGGAPAAMPGATPNPMPAEPTMPTPPVSEPPMPEPANPMPGAPAGDQPAGGMPGDTTGGAPPVSMPA